MVLRSYLKLGLVFIKIIHGAGKIVDSVINRVRVLGCGSHTPTQFFLGLHAPDEIYECQCRAIHFEKNAVMKPSFLRSKEPLDCFS